jgi:hypothetical protein
LGALLQEEAEVVVVVGDYAAVGQVLLAVLPEEETFVGFGQEVVRSEGCVVQVQVFECVEPELQFGEFSE